jgi:3-dehydroquinate synthetase
MSLSGSWAAGTWTVHASCKVQYHVQFADNFLESPSEVLGYFFGAPNGRSEGRLTVIDRIVYDLYGARFDYLFRQLGISPLFLIIEGGEGNKNLTSVETVINAIRGAGVSRRSEPIIAIGGGVVLDIVGFAAGIYRRGTPWLRIPTTLVGQVDAGIGSKTGVNYAGSKNLLGVYHAALGTLIDPTFLASLPARHISNGLSEIIKVAIMKDPDLFSLVEKNAELLIESRFQKTSDPESVPAEVIRRAIHAMLDELADNLWEYDLKRRMDFGHVWGPALEMATLPDLLHGEAVALCMALSTTIASMRGLISHRLWQQVMDTLSRAGLPVWHHLMDDITLMRKAFADAVKRWDGHQLVPLPVNFGEVVFAEVEVREVIEAAKVLKNMRLLYRSRKQAPNFYPALTGVNATSSPLSPGQKIGKVL